MDLGKRSLREKEEKIARPCASAAISLDEYAILPVFGYGLFYEMQQLDAYLEDEHATQALGAALARVLVPGLTIYLHGDLGTGKTALTRALLQAAGHIGPVRSPTYTLAEPYTVLLNKKAIDVVHFDLYRLSSADEFLDAGFREYFNHGNICIVEWPERAGAVLPPPDLEIVLTVSGQGRDVQLHALSDQGIQCLDRLNFRKKP